MAVSADGQVVGASPSGLIEGDDAGGEGCEGLVDVGAALVGDGQASETVEPGVGTLDDPAVKAELLATLDPTGAALLATGTGVLGRVGMKLVGTAALATASAAAHRRDRIQGRGHYRAVVAVGSREGQAERCAAGIDDKVALGARLAAIRRVRASRRPPFFAGTDALSRLARLQSS
ncbi:hypothetical protein ASF25_21275 [Methylobacterium sp. Leaf100]|nr:hypothetical protein ASF25_21275 [Methylobacterium sp. Leaf100]